MFSDNRCEIKCVFPYVVGIRIMSIHISCDICRRLGLHVQIRLYYVLPYKAKISAQHGIGFILDRCIVYFGLTMPNLQKKRLLIFEIFNIKKCTFFFFFFLNRVYYPRISDEFDQIGMEQPELFALELGKIDVFDFVYTLASPNIDQ